MLNPRVSDLPDYPFDRLRTLLDGVEPPAGMKPLVLSVGGQTSNSISIAVQ